MNRNLETKGISLLAFALAAGFAAGQAAQEGAPAPMFSVTNFAGERVSIKDMEDRGSPIFLYFINTQDNTSRSASAYLNRIAGAYTPARSKWFGICNGPLDRARAYMAELNPPYQLMLDVPMASMRAFKAQTSPTVVEIGGDGNVMHIWSGFSAVNLKKINRAMADANGTRPVRMDFSRAPSNTLYGQAFIGGQPNSGPVGGGG